MKSIPELPPRERGIPERDLSRPFVDSVSSSAPSTPIEWVSTRRLISESLAMCSRLPPDIVGVVGIPRSGMLPATAIATHLHLPLFELTSSGELRQLSSTRNAIPSREGRLLVIDDTAYMGSAIKVARSRIQQKAVFAAVFVRPEVSDVVDIYGSILPSPHLLEWNLFNNGVLVGEAHNPVFRNGVATDFDGVLCLDPDVPDADDGPGLDRYREWLINAKPRHLLPRSRPIPLIITARLERFRAETEDWLRKWGIKWNRLVMHPAERASQRGDVAFWKSDILERSGCGFYLESHDDQAKRINEYSGVPTICPDSERVHHKKKSRWVASVNRPEIPDGSRFEPIKVRHLAYVLLPISGNGVWQRNLDQVIPHLPKFNGRLRIGILTKSNNTRYALDSVEDVRRYIAENAPGREFEFVEKPNNPALREGEIWGNCSSRSDSPENTKRSFSLTQRA